MLDAESIQSLLEVTFGSFHVILCCLHLVCSLHYYFLSKTKHSCQVFYDNLFAWIYNYFRFYCDHHIFGFYSSNHNLIYIKFNLINLCFRQNLFTQFWIVFLSNSNIHWNWKLNSIKQYNVLVVLTLDSRLEISWNSLHLMFLT